MKNSIDKSEKNKLLMTLCGKSNKLTVPQRSHSETKKSKMVMMLITEHSHIMLHAPPHSQELKSVLKLISEMKPILNLLLPLLLISETDKMKFSEVNKLDIITP